MTVQAQPTITFRYGRRPAWWGLTGTALLAALLSSLCGCSHPRSPQPQAPLVETSFQPLQGPAKELEPRLRAFFAAKADQARRLVDKDQHRLSLARPGWEVHPDVWRYFAAAAVGNWREVNRLYWRLARLSHQWEESRNDERLATSAWHPVNETFRAYEKLSQGSPRLMLELGRQLADAIPPGSIYFGGTDPGRFLPTFLSESHVEGRPFFTLTQNQLTDSFYLAYLRDMYGEQLRLPTEADVAQAAQAYLQEALDRLRAGQSLADESVQVINRRPQIQGMAAQREVSGKLVRDILESNPAREVFLERGLHADWMFAHLVPAGFIFKLSAQPVEALSEEVVRDDRQFWSRQTARYVGDWLHVDTSVSEVIRFVEKTHLQRDLTGFTGELEVVEMWQRWRGRPVHVDPLWLVSNWRNFIGDLYAWRADQAQTPDERDRLLAEADFAFRQALALCPYSRDVLDRYSLFLARQRRFEEALTLSGLARQLYHHDPQILQRIQEWEAEVRRRLSAG